RHDADRAGRRDQPRFVQAVGRQDQRQARQGPLPPRHGGPRRGLSGSGTAPRHLRGQRAAGTLQTQAREERSPLMKARIKVTLKKGVLDPQGKAIEGALGHLGFSGIEHVRQGKYFEIDLAETDKAKAMSAAKAMCDKLIANTVIENYDIELT